MKCLETKSNVVAYFKAPYEIEVKEAVVPSVKPDFVLVEYLYCGICGGDYSVYLGRRHSYPISLGHEFVGRIVSTGKNVSKLVPGQYVISDFNYRCDKCDFCIQNQSHLCEKNDIELFSNRGFAKYACIHFNYLVPVAPFDYLPRACLIEPLSCVIHACSVAGIHSGMKVLICGGGGIGMLFCFYLTRIKENIVVALHQTNEKKEKNLLNHFNISRFSEKKNYKFDLVIDCSNTVDGLMFSLDKTIPGGKICIMSHLYGCETSFVYDQLCKKELHCSFPLRNGERSNLLMAEKYIRNFWDSSDDDMLSVHTDIIEAFQNKSTSGACKQIIDSSKLAP